MLDWGEEGHRTESEIATLRADFTQEVAVWHKLEHPNVTKVHSILQFLFHLFFYIYTNHIWIAYASILLMMIGLSNSYI